MNVLAKSVHLDSHKSQPMISVINSFKVKSYPEWKAGFDSHAAAREQMGINITGLYKDLNDENSLVITAEMESAEKANAVFSNPEFRAVQAAAGVTESNVVILAKLQ